LPERWSKLQAKAAPVFTKVLSLKLWLAMYSNTVDFLPKTICTHKKPAGVNRWLDNTAT
jgi:hypothetical protein